MAISAINSLNINKVGFKGTQQTAKKAEQPKKNENFIDDNKEVLLTGLALLGLTLGAAAFCKSGKTDEANKAVEAIQETVSNVADKVDPNGREFSGAFGEKGLKKIEQAIGIKQLETTIAEAGPEGSRHAARIANNYAGTIAETFEDGKIHSRADVLAYGKVAGLEI